jgi:hypothetical protein
VSILTFSYQKSSDAEDFLTFKQPVFTTTCGKHVPKSSFHTCRQRGNLLHVQDILHNLFYFPQNAIYFIFCLSFTVILYCKLYNKI